MTHPAHGNQGRIIIIEGVDGVGKSTLAQSWHQSLSAPSALFHAGAPTRHSGYDEYVHPLLPAAEGWTIICDRWHLGEPVWAAIFRRAPLVTVHSLHAIEERIHGITPDVTAIYLHRPWRDLQIELSLRHEPASPAFRGIELYNIAMKHSIFDWQVMTLDEAFQQYLGYSHDIRR